MPIAFMLLVVYVFGGAINSGSDSYVNYLLPGILLITIASGISYTAFRLFLDMKGGTAIQVSARVNRTIRDLFAQQPVSSDIWIALAWCVGILVIAYASAMTTYHRKIA